MLPAWINILENWVLKLKEKYMERVGLFKKRMRYRVHKFKEEILQPNSKLFIEHFAMRILQTVALVHEECNFLHIHYDSNPFC